MSDSSYSKLSQILGDIDLPAAPKRFTDTELFQHWNRAVGDHVAKNTTNLHIQSSVLFVTVNSPTWAHELINNQTSILSNLAELGYSNLTEISIRVTVSASKKPLHESKTSTRKTGERKLTPELQELFTEISQNATNPTTRDLFLRLSQAEPPKD